MLVSVTHALAKSNLIVHLFTDTVKTRRHPSVQDFLIFLAEKLPPDDMGLVCMLVWAIWENRNSLVNGGKTRDSSLVATWAFDLLVEFRKSREVPSPVAPVPPASNSPAWTAPPPGILKLNTGIASHGKSLSFSVGAAIR